MNGKPFSSQYAVHPHLRGAYQFPRPVPVPHIGSSPPTWGIRCSTSPTIDISRFIPTYVGHTAFGPQNAPAGSVHPHTRGAYTGSSRNVNSKIGSSPHTWGIRSPYPAAVPPGRFIPTYVGHTPQPRQPHLHPRFIPTYVGYTYSLPELRVYLHGSSPHTWGILSKARSSMIS